jgi:prepilin-type N-terminal cleavage/methylation domain-containing protein
MMRGLTLIEVMIGVALLGIAVGTLGATAESRRREAVELVLRERALQLLEAHADRFVRGASLDPKLADELLHELPGGVMQSSGQGGLRTFTVIWRGASRLQHLELLAVERAR